MSPSAAQRASGTVPDHPLRLLPAATGAEAPDHPSPRPHLSPPARPGGTPPGSGPGQSGGPFSSEEEFHCAVQPHVPRILGIARRFHPSEDLAWDAVQETLLALWQERQAPRHLGGWLNRTVIHRSLHLRRSSSRRSRYEDLAAGARPQVCESSAPHQGLEQAEAGLHARGALDRLSEEHRQVIWMREVQGLGYAAIAEGLQVPVGTVRSRIHRARAACRHALRPVLRQVGIHA